ncbi:MAG: ABC transporter ATP-binding protein/permease [Nanoarchaeota archaeon]|nr:ABC transporter ATP-binding protein/permease [Nanoarchaeota archaeon]
MSRKKRKISFKYNLGEYWKVLKNYKALFFSLLVVSLLVEALFTVDKFLFKRIIDDGSLFIEGTLLQSVFVQTLFVVLFVFIGIVVARVAGKFLLLHLMNILTSKQMRDIKIKYFNHILRLSHNFHTTHKTGSLISRLGRGSGAVESMTDIIIFNVAPLAFQLVIVGLSLAYFSLIPALSILVITILFISYSFIIQQKQQVHKLRFIQSQDREKAFIGDVFTNVDAIKYYGRENNITRRFDLLTRITRSRAIKDWNYYRWFDAGQLFILAIGSFLLIYFPLTQFLAKEITLGTLVFIYTIYGNVVGPMFGFVYGMRGFYRSMADFQDLFEYGKIENDIKNKPGAKEIDIKYGEIEFKNVDFNYGRRSIFKNFNLKIKPNEKVALVGHSGSGKTTLVKLLNRFYDVNAGGIFIDGKDIREFKQESVRGETGIVPQECILFDDSLYNNIRFADRKAPKNKIIEAIKLAQLDKIVKNFPAKGNTIVGERGIRLSGGEKQRVSIARAILANKKILILDEATSALDSETEHEIQLALSNLLKGRTSIIIAHRLSTIMSADRIIVLKEGKIIQQGTHNDLIRQTGEYKKLWNLQKGGYIE